MAVLKNGILGGISGKVSGVVGFNIFGKDVIRGYAKPANPKTTSQTNQRSKFKAALVFAQAILSSVINEYWRGFKSGMSPFNAFMGVNIALAATTGLVTDAMQILRGSLETAIIGDCLLDGTEADIAFSTTTTGNGLATDKVLCFIWDKVNKVGFLSDGLAVRSDGDVVIDVGSGRSGADLFAYVAFYRGTSPDYLVSNTVGKVLSDV